MKCPWGNFLIYETSYNGLLISLCQNLECKFKNTFGTGMCEFGLGGAFYRRSLTLVCVFMFRCDRQDLYNDVFNGVAREMQRLLAIAAVLCAVTVSSHRQKGWGQHAQITLRRAESLFNPQACPENIPCPSWIPNVAFAFTAVE